MSENNKQTSDKQQNGNDFIANVIGHFPSESEEYKKAQELISNIQRAFERDVDFETTTADIDVAKMIADEFIELLSFDLRHDQTARRYCQFWKDVKSILNTL